MDVNFRGDTIQPIQKGRQLIDSGAKEPQTGVGRLSSPGWAPSLGLGFHVYKKRYHQALDRIPFFNSMVAENPPRTVARGPTRKRS